MTSQQLDLSASLGFDATLPSREADESFDLDDLRLPSISRKKEMESILRAGGAPNSFLYLF